jgi:hypothetical protein
MTIVVQSVTTTRDYLWLKDQVAAWMHRNDLTGEVADLIYLAEVRIRTRLTERVQDVTGTIATVAGTQYATLPADFLSVKSLSIPGVMPTIDYMAPDEFNQQFEPAVSGTPRCYTIIGNRIYLGPTPDAIYSISAMYRFDMPSLTNTNLTNTLLAKWPNIYLFGALVEACDFSRNLPLRDSFNQRFLDAIDGANVLEFNKNGPMRVRIDGRNW